MAVGKSRKKVSNYDPLKERGISELAAVLEGAGFEVRREKLKQGIGYKVMSGTCHFNDADIIFVDRKLPQDDQISFLATKIVAQGIEVEADKLPSVSTKVVKQINDGVRELKENAANVEEGDGQLQENTRLVLSTPNSEEVFSSSMGE